MIMWQPIDTAPKDNKRPLFLARFNDDGTIQSFDYNGSWECESESWEMPGVYYFWASEDGNVEEPTHWMYQPDWFSVLPGAQQCRNCNGMGDRFDPSGEKIPCDLCESHLEEIRSLVAEAAHDIISGSDFWLSISLAAKKIYTLPGAKEE